MHGEDLLQPVATRYTPFSREFCGFVGRLTHFFCGCPILMPRSINAAANRARNFSCKSLENSSGGTRTRTGDTMIFSHMSRPLGMRFYRISKRISVHRVSLDIAWCRPYCCITVDMAFVTLRGTRSRTHTSARLTRLLGYSRPPLSFRDVPGSRSRSVSLRNFAEKQEKESRQADSNRGHMIFSGVICVHRRSWSSNN